MHNSATFMSTLPSLYVHILAQIAQALLIMLY